MSETKIIQWIRRQSATRSPNLKTGIGDDCSVIAQGKKEILVTCDALVEGIHFRRAWGSWNDWGEKAVGAALSDIAAMGGTPKFGWLHLSIPKNLRESDVQKFCRGFLTVLKKFGATLAGGNISRSPKGFQAVTTIWGERERGIKMLRSSAKPGDLVYVAGRLGKSAANRRHVPIPQIQLGRWLAKNKIANACIDVSDGLLKDLHHIALASKVRIVLHTDKIPFVPPRQRALTYGEDYLLAFTVPPSKEKWVKNKKGLTKIGVIQKGKPSKTLPKGYEHRW